MKEAYKYARIITDLEAEAENAALEAEFVKSTSIPVELMEEAALMMLSEKKIASLVEESDAKVQDAAQSTFQTQSIKEALKNQAA